MDNKLLTCGARIIALPRRGYNGSAGIHVVGINKRVVRPLHERLPPVYNSRLWLHCPAVVHEILCVVAKRHVSCHQLRRVYGKLNRLASRIAALARNGNGGGADGLVVGEGKCVIGSLRKRDGRVLRIELRVRKRDGGRAFRAVVNALRRGELRGDTVGRDVERHNAKGLRHLARIIIDARHRYRGRAHANVVLRVKRRVVVLACHQHIAVHPNELHVGTQRPRVVRELVFDQAHHVFRKFGRRDNER